MADSEYVGAMQKAMPGTGILSQAKAYASHSAQIVGSMAWYAAHGEQRGMKNGLLAMRLLGQEIKNRLIGGSPIHRCPICGWNGQRFGPIYYVDEYRENVRCYGCGSTDRARLIKLYIAQHLNDFFTASHRRVLDIGPLRYSRSFFPDSIDYISFDLVSPIATVNGDLCAAPFADNYCDLWLCFHVLDLIADDTQAMCELFRILRPSGIGLLDHAMNWDTDTVEFGEPKARQCGHRRRYGRDLPDRLRAVGFDIQVMSAEEMFDQATRDEYGILPRRIVICRKGTE